MNILVKEENRLVHSTVDLIAEYCEVSSRTVRQLVTEYKEEFLNLSEEIQKDFEGRLNATDFKVPQFVLVKKNNRNEIDWKHTKLYQPHIEYLLMLMKNTKVITKHMRDLIRELFVLKAETLAQEYQNRVLQKERDMLLLEKENNKLGNKVHELELDKLIDWDEEWISASRYVEEYRPDLSSSYLLDILADKNLVEVRVVQRQIRIPIDGKSKYGNKGTLLFNKTEIDKLF